MILFGSQFTTLAGSASLPLCGDRNERLKVEEIWNSNSNISSRDKTEVHPMLSVCGMAPLEIAYKETTIPVREQLFLTVGIDVWREEMLK